MNKHRENMEQFLNPEVLRDRVISASMFLIAHEILIESIVGRIRDFFINGFDEKGMIVSDEYSKEVLILNKSPLYASLAWLKIRGVVSEEDLEKFEKIKIVRNSLAHELSKLVSTGETFDHEETFQVIIELIRKIEVWWIVNCEIATDPDYDGSKVDENEIVPGSILSIQMMLEVLSGNEELLKKYKQTRAEMNMRL